MDDNRPNKCFIVLGMHRSATSLVAKGLFQNGVSMGGPNLINQPKPDNVHGHFEDRGFIQLNNAILKAAGGSWKNPPRHEDILNQSSRFSEKIKDTISAASEGQSMWGWKDPRTVLTIDLYTPHLYRPHIISVFRDSRDVAKSLIERNDLSIQARNQISFEQGFNLAVEYNRRLLSFLKRWNEEQAI